MESENRYDQWHTLHQVEDDISPAWYQFVLNALHPSDLTQKKILEIGCGRGGFSNHLANLPGAPQQIVASDFSASALAIASEKYSHSKIFWKKEDIMNLSFESNSFDTVISCETIEHVPHPSKALRELFRVLKPGGRLFLTCPSYFNLFGIWCLYRSVIGKPFTEGGQPYVNYILMPQVYLWIMRAGFRVEKFHSTEIIIPARIPKHFYFTGVPRMLKIFGSRTFYILSKP
jgi:ubiquinone/menaquinone biosynthesis C-methylase UbiE